jgi:predicted amidohydrolase YtcJ
LRDAGVRVAAGTDAPFGSLDPWAAMAAAVQRRTGRGRALGAIEEVDPITALQLFLGHADRPACSRALTPGRVADLCVLREPWRAMVRDLAATEVRATFIGGALATP